MRYLLIMLCVFSLSIATTQASDESDLLLQSRLRAHIEFLADDLMLGRQPGSDGYNIAANYVASQYQQMGLMPAGNEGTWFQEVPLRQSIQVPGSAELILVQGDETISFEFVEEFYMSPSLSSTSSELEAGMVFAGYGIDAAELEHQDYENINVEGKVVVTLYGQPHDFPSEEGAHFASSTEKLKAAARHGAAGVLFIHTPRTQQRFQWERVKSIAGTPNMGWINASGEVHGSLKQIKGGAMLRHTFADVLFENAPSNLATLLERDANGEPLTGFDLEGTITMRQRSEHDHLSSPNVAAVLPGSDPLLAGEYVVYTAHLDHIGELPEHGDDEAEKDRINNGAMDNASGVSVMLETARMFTEGPAPRRSILFIAVTGEEKGLVGSEYYAMNPTVPIESIVSEVNLDMPVLLYEFADVIAFGASHSTMGETVREAAQAYNTELSPDPFPEQNIFVRSDHYRFVQQGVPSVFLVTGMKSVDDSIDTKPIFEGFLHEHYHKPSDDLSQPLNYKAAATFTRINAKIGELIANDPTRPSWHEGDFFGRTFAK